MKRRMLEWIGIISLLLSIGLTVLWADSALAKRRYDVLSLAKNLNIVVANGYVIVFGGLEEGQPIELRVFLPRSFGAPGPLKEHAYFDWFIPALALVTASSQVRSRFRQRPAWERSRSATPSLRFRVSPITAIMSPNSRGRPGRCR